MGTRRSRVVARAAAVACAFALPMACNLFVSLDQCTADSDCPSGAVCDPVGRFCMRVTGEGGDGGNVATDGDATAPGEAAVDANADANARPCDLTKPFSSSSLVKGLEETSILSARLNSDELSVLLALVNPASTTSQTDLFSASRADRDASFALSGPIPNVNADNADEYWPTLSANGLLLFFESGRSLEKVDGSYVTDQARVWSATRSALGADFEAPEIQSTFALEAGSSAEGSPYLHPGGRSLYFLSYARGGLGSADIFVALLDEIGLVTTVKNVTAVNSPAEELAPVVTLDDKSLYFAREDVTNIAFTRDIWLATRPGAFGDFGPPVRVEELVTPYDEFPSWVSDDQCRLYFISDRPGAAEAGADAGRNRAFHLWVAERPQ